MSKILDYFMGRKKEIEPKFKKDPCKTCGHPEGIHHPQCWAFGLIEPKCRKHCMKFERDNLIWLEGRYEELHKAR